MFWPVWKGAVYKQGWDVWPKQGRKLHKWRGGERERKEMEGRLELVFFKMVMFVGMNLTLGTTHIDHRETFPSQLRMGLQRLGGHCFDQCLSTGSLNLHWSICQRTELILSASFCPCWTTNLPDESAFNHTCFTSFTMRCVWQTPLNPTFCTGGKLTCSHDWSR